MTLLKSCKMKVNNNQTWRFKWWWAMYLGITHWGIEEAKPFLEAPHLEFTHMGILEGEQ